MAGLFYLARNTDKAEALKVWAKRAQYGLEIQNDCAEIKLRAERRIGELTRELEKATGGRPLENLSQRVTSFEPKTNVIKAAGLNRMEVSRNEQLAAIPAEVFEKQITQTKAARHLPV